MLEKLFHGVFDSSYVYVIPVEKFLLCVGVALLIGGIVAFTASRKSRLSFSFFTTLLALPALSCMVIMMVNGNVGVGVATAGTFSLVRFRSAKGTAREMALIFLCMVTGLITGMGYLAYAVLFTLLMCVLYLAISLFDPDAKGLRRRLRVTVPEDLDYTGIFKDTLAAYCKDWKLTQVKTVNMGALFRLTYNVTLRDPGKEKAFIDDLRLQNGNLEISIADAEMPDSDL